MWLRACVRARVPARVQRMVSNTLPMSAPSAIPRACVCACVRACVRACVWAHTRVCMVHDIVQMTDAIDNVPIATIFTSIAILLNSKTATREDWLAQHMYLNLRQAGVVSRAVTAGHVRFFIANLGGLATNNIERLSAGSKSHTRVWFWSFARDGNPLVAGGRLLQLQQQINTNGGGLPLDALDAGKACSRRPGMSKHLVTLAGCRADPVAMDEFVDANPNVFQSWHHHRQAWVSRRLRAFAARGAIIDVQARRLSARGTQPCGATATTAASTDAAADAANTAATATATTAATAATATNTATKTILGDFEIDCNVGLLLAIHVEHEQGSLPGQVTGAELRRTRQLLGAILVAAHAKLRLDGNSIMVVDDGRRALLKFAYNNFRACMRDKTFNVLNVPPPSKATSADLADFESRHVRYARKTYASARACFKITLEFARRPPQYVQGRMQHAERRKHERRGLTKMRDLVQELLDESAPDILDLETKSDAGMNRLRRFSYVEGNAGRAVRARIDGVRVPGFRSIKRIRADQAAVFASAGLHADEHLFTDGDTVVFVAASEFEAFKIAQAAKTDSRTFKHVGAHGNIESWVGLAARVAKHRGMLAGGVEFVGTPGEIVGTYLGLQVVAWFDGLECGPKPMAQLVFMLIDPTGTFLNRNFSFPIPISMWQDKEYLGGVIMSAACFAARSILVEMEPEGTKLVLGLEITLISLDHKAAGSFLGGPGSGGTVRIESAQAGLKIGNVDDEEVVLASDISTHHVEYLHCLYSTLADFRTTLVSIEETFGTRSANPIIKWVAKHPDCGVVLPRRPSGQQARDALNAFWPTTITDSFLRACLFDGTISAYRFKKHIHGPNASEFGRFSFPGLVEHNKRVVDDIWLPEMAKICADASSGERETTLATLLLLDWHGAADGKRLLQRVGLHGTKEFTFADYCKTLRPTEQCIDTKRVLVVTGYCHNLTFLTKLCTKIARGVGLHPQLLQTYGANKEQREEKVQKLEEELLCGMHAQSFLGAHTYGHNYRSVITDSDHHFRSAPSPVRKLVRHPPPSPLPIIVWEL